MEAYESVMGAGTPLREDWLEDMGIDKNAIPDLLTVVKVLNKHGYGYMYKDRFFNFIQQQLPMPGGEHIIDDAI